jgi:hypothetical protein
MRERVAIPPAEAKKWFPLPGRVEDPRESGLVTEVMGHSKFDVVLK